MSTETVRYRKALDLPKEVVEKFEEIMSVFNQPNPKRFMEVVLTNLSQREDMAQLIKLIIEPKITKKKR